MRIVSIRPSRIPEPAFLYEIEQHVPWHPVVQDQAEFPNTLFYMILSSMCHYHRYRGLRCVGRLNGITSSPSFLLLLRTPLFSQMAPTSSKVASSSIPDTRTSIEKRRSTIANNKLKDLVELRKQEAEGKHLFLHFYIPFRWLK